MDDEGNTRPNKFVRETENSMKPDAPDFLKEIQRAADDQLEDEGIGGFYHPDDGKKPRKRLGASELSEAEKQAVDDNRRTAYNQLSGVEDAKEKEEVPEKSGYYRKSLKERYQNVKGNPRTKAMAASFGKYGAVSSIFIALLIMAFTSFGSMSTQLNAWKENIYAHYGQNSAVLNKRSNFLMKTLLQTEKGTSVSITGKTRFKIGKKLSQKLKTEGIDYVEQDVNGKKVKMLVVMDDDGNGIPIVANDKDLSRIQGIAGSEIDIDGKKIKLGDTSMTLQTARNKSTAFNTAYNKATLTVTGKMAGWFSQFGKVPETLFKRLIGDNARNQTAEIKDNSTKEEVEGTMTKAVEVSDEDVQMKGEKDDPDAEEEEGSEKKRVGLDSGDLVDADDNGNGSTTYGELTAKDGRLSGGNGDVSAKLNAKAQKAAALGGGGSAICGFIRAIGAITATVGAIQTLNAVNYTSKYLELADKVKAQDSNNGTNQAMLLLNEKRPNEVYDEEGNAVETEPMATTESAGFNMAFAQDDVIDEDSPVTMMVNRENAMTIAMKNMTKNTALEWVAPIVSGLGTIGSGAAAASTCIGIQIGAAVANIVSDVALAILSGGVGNAIKAFVKGAVEGALMTAIMTAVGMIVGFITPMVAEWIGGNLAKVFFGEVGGTVLWAGAQSLMNSNLQMSTGYLPDENGAVELFAMTQEVEKDWARYDQQTMSPFDTSSKYTFLGSIVSSLSPIINKSSSKGIAGTVSSVASLAGDSALAVLNPTASAADGMSDFELSLASDDNCTTLHSVGAEGIETCHKYNGAFVGDLTSQDADQIIDNINALDATTFDGEYEDGNPKINPDSDLAKFIVACVVSDSQPGEVDAAVQGFVGGHMETGSVVGDGLLNFGLGSIPFVGDILDIFDGTEQQANLVWNTRQACTARTNDPVLNEKIRYFSTYNLDQRTLEEMGVIENNAVTAFLDDYYEQNPLDQTYEGKIARLSGQTKEEVEDTLAFLDYFVAVYEYDPSTKYAFGEPSVKIDKPLRLDHESVTQVADAKQTISNLFANIVYADVRNRVTVS